MGPVGRLGELYNLSPATVAGLANISGSDPQPAGPPPQDPDSFDAWQAAAAAAGAPDGVKNVQPGQTIGDVQGDKSNIAGPEPAPKDPAGPPAIQGPAADSFPTVRSLDASVANGQAMPVAPAVNVPAGWQPGTHAVSRQYGMNPADLEPAQYNQDVASGHEILSAKNHLEAAQMRGMADAVYSAAHAQASKAANDRMAQLNQERDSYVAKETQRLDQMALAAQKEVDPEAYWKEKGTGAKMAAALAIGMGQFAALFRGGSNAALQIIQTNISDNIKAQQANIANANHAVDLRQNLYARNLAAFGDKERATLATKVQYLDQVAAMADQQRAQAGNVDNEAAHQQMLANIYKLRAADAKEFAKLTFTQSTEQMNEHFVPAHQVGGGVGDKGHDALYVPTLGGYARDEASAKKLNEKGALRMQIGENMHQIYGLMGEAKGLSSTSVDGYQRLKQIDEQIRTLTNRTLTATTVLAGQGAMSKGDMAVSEEAAALKDINVQGTMNFNIERKRANVLKAADMMLTDHRLEGEGYGVQKGTERYVQGPHGPTPVRQLQGRNAAPSKITQGASDLVRPPEGQAK